MSKRCIKIPEKCSAQIKTMWQDGEGFWAAAAPGRRFDTLSGYLLQAESEDELRAAAVDRIRPEEYEVPDLAGRRINIIPYRMACRLLPRLRLGFSIISTSTGENFERIQPSVYRGHLDFLTPDQEDGAKIYSLSEYSLTVREELEKDGAIRSAYEL